MKILNFGSLNIDHVYQVPHFVAPGETISSTAYETFAGGKGANQSAALAKAGAPVFHAGKVGEDGRWLVENLAALGVNTDFTRITNDSTGHAIIQVDPNGENAIFLFPGTNRQILREEIDETLAQFESGDILLLQNEINEIPTIIESAHSRGLTVCLNPAPMDDAVMAYPLDKVGILIVNETEAAGLAGVEGVDAIMAALAEKYPACDIILTLGSEGVRARTPTQELTVPAEKVDAVDTTAAGDCFIGYYLATRVEGQGTEACLQRACKAAAISVTRPGATDSIPTAHEAD